MDRRTPAAGYSGGGRTTLKPEATLDPSNPVVPERPRAADADDPAAERARVARARAGDASAFRELVDAHRDRAYGLALRILRSPADAEEVAQDAFVRAWLALPGYRGEARFGTWLHRIVARRALDRAEVLRGRGRREAVLDEAEASSPDPGTDPGRRAMLRLRVERLLEALSPPQRAVVTMFYSEGCSVEQVADALGMPGGTVKTHLSRGRAALREAWMRLYGEEPPA